MRLSENHLRIVRSLQAVIRDLDNKFVGRREAANLLVLAVVAREHLLLIGPPGTAKTDLIQRFAGLIHARPFTYLLTRFTEPSEIFGPLDFELFQKGVYRIKSEDMLPDSEVVFLDEVFQGSSAILNTLLTLVNERRFHNGAKAEATPLISMFGASSELPDDPALRAFGDRFLLRLEVEPVSRTRLPELLERGWEQERQRILGDGVTAAPSLQQMDLQALSSVLRDVDLRPVRGVFGDLVGELLAQGVALSDRRIVRGQKLIAAAALLREDGTARARDLWPLAHFWTEQNDAGPVRDAVYERVTADGADARTPRRSTTELETLARHQVSLVHNRPGRVARGSVIAALRTVNELLTDARSEHPAAHATHAAIQGLRDQLTLLLDEQN
ncbi:AAA family ATPase [Streptosporangium sp. LJ11]|uniref:AAA family ATPase n=1 Tax=Streptosporangium sp. LJ11 TaxID=3436927 RepID=UPI003F7A718A